MNKAVSITDFLPVADLVPILKENGEPSGAHARVVPFAELDAILKKGMDDMMAFGCRLLAIACVQADGTPLGSEQDWIDRTTFKNRDKVLELIKFVGEVNGVLAKDEQKELGNDSSPTDGSSSNSNSVSASDAPAKNSGKD